MIFRRGTALIALGIMLSVALIYGSQPPGETTASQGGAFEGIAARTEGCVVCQRMVSELTPAEFENDAHDMPCSTCHHPHTRPTVDEWRATCTSSNCHPRAWTETQFHRIDVDVFVVCVDCHRTHEWTADGENCQSCHDLESGLDTVPTPNVAGVNSFTHSYHAELECSACHDSQTRHATLKITEKSQCINCHHTASGASCASCHSSPPTDAHELEIHETMACSDCHGAVAKALPVNRDLCVACHRGQEDHMTGMNCAGCHKLPSLTPATTQ